jgi:hypothetical protein
MTRLQGTYRATRDGQTYRYEATCSPSRPVTYWDAKVWLADRLIALPSGKVAIEAGADPTEAVRREVADAIEHRLHAD